MASELWQRQDSDTKKSYEAFHIYLTMGRKRSLRKVAQQLDKSLTIIGRWSEAHNWQARVAAYDAHLNAIDLLDYEDKRLASRHKRQDIVQGLESLLGRVMTEYQKELNPQTISQIATAAKTIMGESRAEFNDEPAKRTELTGKDGGAIEQKITWEQMFNRDTDSE